MSIRLLRGCSRPLVAVIIYRLYSRAAVETNLPNYRESRLSFAFAKERLLVLLEVYVSSSREQRSVVFCDIPGVFACAIFAWAGLFSKTNGFQPYKRSDDRWSAAAVRRMAILVPRQWFRRHRRRPSSTRRSVKLRRLR